MIAVIYVSSAGHRMSDGELGAILAQSRRNNARDDITGMLLYADGNFIQAIEGPDQAVDGLLKRIEGDARHDGVIKVARYPIAERQFPNWSMGFRPVERRDVSELLAFTSLESPLFDPDTPEAASLAHRLLEVFRGTNQG